jgi:hypothetical protein
MAAYVKCIAKQMGKNYVPGGSPAPGMLLDEMDTQVDKALNDISVPRTAFG